MIRILIADDHKMFRQGLISMLAEEEEVEVIAEASNGTEVLQLLGEKEPDVLLLDIEMPEMDGFDTMRAIKKLKLPTRVLALTMHRSPEFIKNIIKAGASGYLKKDAGKATLMEAIKTVFSTGTFYSSETSKLVLESMSDNYSSSQISRRELEIIKLIADQYTTTEIAETLFISRHTVESHRQNILLKLGLKNTAGLVKYAIQKGLI